MIYAHQRSPFSFISIVNSSCTVLYGSLSNTAQSTHHPIPLPDVMMLMLLVGDFALIKLLLPVMAHSPGHFMEALSAALSN